MPSGSPTEERYVVYSVDTDDSTSAVEEHQVLFKEPEYKELKENTTASKSVSPIPSIKWQSYWTCKEKCCCLWNFLVIVALSGLSTVIILAHNRVIDIRFQAQGVGDVSEARSAPSSGTTVTGSPTSGPNRIKTNVSITFGSNSFNYPFMVTLINAID